MNFPSVLGGSANLVKKEAKFCKLYLEWKRARAKHSLMVQEKWDIDNKYFYQYVMHIYFNNITINKQWICLNKSILYYKQKSIETFRSCLCHAMTTLKYFSVLPQVCGVSLFFFCFYILNDKHCVSATDYW